MVLDLAVIDEKSIKRKVDDVYSILMGRKIVVAFSGGVDSVTLAALAKDVAKEVLLVMQIGDSVAEGEKENADFLASKLGLNLLFLEYNEYEENESYTENPPNRCYYCKWILHHKLENLRKKLKFDIVVNGTNFSDLKGHRPGYQAIQEFGVMSPFVETKLTKIEIRYIAKEKDLTVWNKPATPCLASRVKTGIRISGSILKKIDRAEQFLKSNFNINIIRVRLVENNTASIEVEKPLIPQLIDNFDLIDRELQILGFSSVRIDPEGYRPYNPKER